MAAERDNIESLSESVIHLTTFLMPIYSTLLWGISELISQSCPEYFSYSPFLSKMEGPSEI